MITNAINQGSDKAARKFNSEGHEAKGPCVKKSGPTKPSPEELGLKTHM